MAKKAKKAIRKKPRTHGPSGRNNEGKFVNGNQCSVGNASSGDKRSKWLKKALYDAVTEKDITKIAKKLVAKAKQGDVPATKELFDRLWGRAMQEIEGEIKLVQMSKPLSIEEMKQRLKGLEDAGNGLATN